MRWRADLPLAGVDSGLRTKSQVRVVPVAPVGWVVLCEASKAAQAERERAVNGITVNRFR